MSKHTPGPWEAVKRNDGYGDSYMLVQTVQEPGGWEIADVRADVPCHKANARLISAAPELLEALEALIEETDPMQLNAGEPWCRVRAAIAKAKGEQV